MSTEKKSVFKTLSEVNVNDKTEKKNGLTYLSWAHAWGEVVKRYPSADYDVVNWVGADGVERPYLFDPLLGYLVKTWVEVDGKRLPMQLFVMDGANKPKKDKSYTYKKPVWKNGSKTYIDAEVEAADMFDINTTIMRCLAKNLAMHGLGLYIYAGEDLPEQEAEATTVNKAPQATQTAKATKATPAKEKAAETQPKQAEAPKSTKAETKQADPKAKLADKDGNLQPNPAAVESTPDAERKEKAKAYFKKLTDEATALKFLIKEKGVRKFAKVSDYIDNTDVDEVLSVYKELRAKLEA